MRNFVFITIFLFAQQFVSAQEILIKNIEQTESPTLLKINMVLYNDILEHNFYKMVLGDICFGLLQIEILDVASKRSFYYFPCEGPMQLDNIKFTEENTFVLLAKQQYSFSYFIDVKQMAYIKRSGLYSLQLAFNFDELPEPNTGIFLKKIITNSVQFKLKGAR